MYSTESSDNQCHHQPISYASLPPYSDLATVGSESGDRAPPQYSDVVSASRPATAGGRTVVAQICSDGCGTQTMLSAHSDLPWQHRSRTLGKVFQAQTNLRSKRFFIISLQVTDVIVSLQVTDVIVSLQITDV